MHCIVLTCMLLICDTEINQSINQYFIHISSGKVVSYVFDLSILPVHHSNRTKNEMFRTTAESEGEVMAIKLFLASIRLLLIPF